jgi:hypothetical protein
MLFVSQIQAQEEQEEKRDEQKQITITIPRLRLGIEAGVNLLFGEVKKPEQIRESQSYYSDGDYDFHCGFVPQNHNFSFFYFGLKPEYMLSKRFTASVGVRFSFYTVTLHSDKDYFLWKISETETNTNYIKIKTISQRNYYLGVPLEIKYFPREKDYAVRQYFIVGTSLNFLVTSINKVVFPNPAMEKYSSEIMSQIGDPRFFQGIFYAGAGLKLGKMNNPFGYIEAHFPVVMYGNNKSKSLATTQTAPGFEFQATLQIPFFKEHQLTYTVND